MKRIFKTPFIVFAIVGVFAVVMAVLRIVPQAKAFLSGALLTSAGTISETGVMKTPTPKNSSYVRDEYVTPTPFSDDVSATSWPAATPTSALTFQLLRTLLPPNPGCDRPGWFPENFGLREHAIFHYNRQYYLIASTWPEEHVLQIARSADMCHWDELPPIFEDVQSDAWDAKSLRAPFVYEENGVYYLYYTGVTWNGTERILWATSTNPANSAAWQFQGEAFHPLHSDTAWSSGSKVTCHAPMVLKDSDIYYLYYTGDDEDGGIVGVAIAFSPSGPWEDLGAILPAVDALSFESPFVVARDGRFYLFYYHVDQGTLYHVGDTPIGPWSESLTLSTGWVHGIWQDENNEWFTSFLTDYMVTIFPLTWNNVGHLLQPDIVTPSAFLQDIPIWTHSGEPAKHEVTLFRYPFILEQSLESVTLNLFADTRYEVWLDGEWMGRGPARFSYRLREYDVYALDHLNAGEHTLAVLVQWSPNNRRSESIAPFLQGHLRGFDKIGKEHILCTNSTWKALRSNAWKENARLVDIRGLIGSTELLDLSLLPVDWNQPDFVDDSWPTAVVINPLAVNYQPDKDFGVADDELASTQSTEKIDLGLMGSVGGVIYRPRTILPLSNVPISVTVLDAGFLSPGRLMGELLPSTGKPYRLPFTAQAETNFIIESLVSSKPETSIRLNGRYLSWQSVGETRPDVYTATLSLSPGEHTLTFEHISATGLTFSVSNDDVRFEHFPMTQGLQAGRRVLLAEYDSALEAFDISTVEGAPFVLFPTAPSYLVLDLGRTVHGRISAEILGEAGTIVDIGWDERLLSGTHRPMPYPGTVHEEWGQVDSWVLDGTVREISTIDARTGRYILIAVWGNQLVDLRNIHVYEERYPLTLRGSFKSSEPLLNCIWQVGVDTLYPNMTDAYTDTPWRERGQWWGDAYVADQANRVSFGETALLRRGLQLMADSYEPGNAPGLVPNSSTSNMTDYMMLWVHSLVEYVQFTADTTILGETYSVLQKFMAQLVGYENEQTGLLDFPATHWWNYVYVDTYGWLSRQGQSTAVNALYYDTLLKAAFLAEQNGDAESAARWQQKAEELRRQTNELLFSFSQHRYQTTYYQGDYQPPNPFAQAWPLVYNLPPSGYGSEIADALYELISKKPATEPNIGVYGFHWVLNALGNIGYIEEGLDLIRTYHGYMLEQGATTWWERMDADREWTQSLSHSWGTSPTWFLTTYVLGARALGPVEWEFAPALEGVDSVSGVLPLYDGELEVFWRQLRCGEYQLQVTASEGTHGRVVIPRVSNQTIMLDEQLVWQRGQSFSKQVVLEAEKIYINLSAGDYLFYIDQGCP